MRSQPIGTGESFMSLMDRVSDVASTDRPALVVGERGTGKELIASRLHFLSPRWERVFVRVNCAAFNAEELDRELFGRTFMDGREDTNGRFFEANEGTLFLDAVEQMSPRLQEKLMHTLDHGQIQATGELYNEDVDVRVVAATSVDLPSAVQCETFRADLLDRLAFHVITLPPLRNRLEDIPALVEHFGKQVVRELGAESFPGLTAEAHEALRNHPFPGNVRELKTVVARSTVRAFLADESLAEPISELRLDPFESPYRLAPTQIPPTPTRMVTPAVFSEIAAHANAAAQTASHGAAPAHLETQAGSPASPDFPSRVMTFERRLIDEAMRSCGDHQGRAAERLGLSYHQLRGLLRKHGLKK